MACSIRDLKISGTDFLAFAGAGDVLGLARKVFAGKDVIIGSRFDDVLVGYVGSNSLSGGLGDDILCGSMRGRRWTP